MISFRLKIGVLVIFQLTPLTLSSLAGPLSGQVFNLSAEVRTNFFSNDKRIAVLQINRKAAILPCSKFAFRDATRTFPNSLTGNAIWKCFWHRVYTNAREWKQHSPKFFFPRNQTFSSLKYPLVKSRQQTICIMRQFSTPLNQVNHPLNGLNNGKKRTSKL